MPKRLYLCEVCGKRNNLKQVVCISCVERDLLALNDRISYLEKELKELKDSAKHSSKKLIKYPSKECPNPMAMEKSK